MGAGKSGLGEERGDVLAGHFQHIGADAVDLGESHDKLEIAEELDDLDVLAGLGHDAVIGGDHQQQHVDGSGAGDHVADEILVSGHVHDAHQPPPFQQARGEAQVDAHAAAFSSGRRSVSQPVRFFTSEVLP